MPPGGAVISALRAPAHPLAGGVVAPRVMDQTPVTVAVRPPMVTTFDAITTAVRPLVPIGSIKRPGPMRAGAPRVRPAATPKHPRVPKPAGAPSKTPARHLQARAVVTAPRRASALVAKRRGVAFAAVSPWRAVPILVRARWA